MHDGFRYCVLYIRDTEHQSVKKAIEKRLPKNRGYVFYPCMEYYRRDDKEVKIRAIFPGYIFLYTDLDIKEVHELMLKLHIETRLGAQELALSERRMSNPDFLLEEDDTMKLYDLSDVDDDEAAFFDCLREGNGLLSMSSGYEERTEYERKNGKGVEILKKYVVMEGPLKTYEDKIMDVDKHNRRAYLAFEINRRYAQAGFNCLPKAHWFPDGNSEIITLSDGTELDITELKRSVMVFGSL